MEGRKTTFMFKSQFDHVNGHFKTVLTLTTEQLSTDEDVIDSLVERVGQEIKDEIMHGSDLTKNHLLSQNPNFKMGSGTLFDAVSGVEQVSDKEEGVPIKSA